MTLLDWIEDPRGDRGMRFLNDDGGWDFRSYEALASSAQNIASQLHESGVGAGEVVCLFLPTGPSLVASIFGVWISGNTISPLVPPMMFEDEPAYIEHVARILQTASPSIVVTDGSYRSLVERIVLRAGVVSARVVEVDEVGVVRKERSGLADVALLQFTSGSSGTPRGVMVSFDNLRSNIEAIRGWIDMGKDDVTATWLPLFHDMGLIGCLLTPAVNGSDVWVMRPDQFVREPHRWLECFGKRGASLSAAPNFGYGYVARKVTGELLDGCDFSNWRVAIAGAETVDAGALTHFAETLAPFGFNKRAFLPAYGLAEATLATTGGSADVLARSVKLDWESLEFGKVVGIEAVGDLGTVDHEKSLGWLVGSGTPHDGITVSIVDEGLKDLPLGSLGEILVDGPSVAMGYRGAPEPGATRFSPRGLLTGDAGFMFEGELYVVGRIADSLKIRGRTVYADDLEARLVAVTKIKRGRCVVMVLPTHSGGAILVVAEEVDPEWMLAAGKVIKSAVGESISVKVVSGPRGTILRTSSGKPRRRVMWKLEREGKLQTGVSREF